MRVQFFLKKHSHYGEYCGDGASGLLNSTKFIVDMLNANGVVAEMTPVNDNNDIDREVTRFDPDVVIIEALWVIPSKFDILSQLHPNIVWVVRLHSDLPFLASEGIASKWIFEYIQRGVRVATNKERTFNDLQAIIADSDDVLYLPNYYHVRKAKRFPFDNGLHIGCFGAIRPLKNQFLQAVAAIEYADRTDKQLFFHVNATRCEQGGDRILRNLRSLFDGTGYTLVEESWLDHEEFLKLIARMDLAMSVSFSETFCITAADAVSMGVPLVCSNQVPWASKYSIADTTDTTDIVDRITFVLNYPCIPNTFNRHGLRAYARKSKNIWLDTLSSLTDFTDFT